MADDRYGRNPYDQRYRQGNRDYGHDNYERSANYDADERGMFDRASDEVRSWFGDEEAERRRQADDLRDSRDYGDRYGNYGNRSYEERSYGERGYGARRSGERDTRFDNRGGGDYGYGSRGQGNRGPSDYRGSERGYEQRGSGMRGYGRDNRGIDRGSQQGHDYGQERDYRSARQREHAGDDHYRSWRDRQMEAFDRDYDDYRRERQSSFENDFGTWRTTRQSQREQLQKVREHMDVVGSDGEHVGTVDKVENERIKLTKTDQDAHGQHHLIPASWLSTVDTKITLNKTAKEAQDHWKAEQSQQGGGGTQGGGQGSSQGGPGMLNRSFSGTY